jgi:(p)ppGpp synthase/HD superfamily hydrolase
MSSSSIAEALSYVSAKVSNQQRTKGVTVPLLSHLLGVADIAYQYRDSAFRGSSEDLDDLIVAALLHEIMDSDELGTLRTEIEKKFGTSVLTMVDGCAEPHATGDYFEMKQAYFDFLAEASDSVAFILACDELHDLKVILSGWLRSGPAIWQTIPAGAKNTLWYYEGLCRVFARNGSHPLLSEMEYLLAILSDEIEQAHPYFASSSVAF